jgi:arylsulfatase A-like enzyme
MGRSLLPLIAGETGSHRDAVFCEGGSLRQEAHCKEMEGVTSPDFLYYPRLKYQRGDGPEHTKAVMVRTERYKYVRRLYETDELYDLQTDPHETVNRIDDPAMAGVLELLKERLLTFYMETTDAVPHDVNRRN